MVMNTSKPRSKTGLVDSEINAFTKLLFVGSFILSFVMVSLKGFEGTWIRYLVRFLLLFSYVIPISLRVHLDLSKLMYAWFIHRDENIPGTVVRSSTIPEELGRIGYLLTDKTGTLTQNLMIFKRLHLGTVSYTNENRDQISNLLKQQYKTTTASVDESQQSASSSSKTRNIVKKTDTTKVVEAIKALALCHNVTPAFEEQTSISLHPMASSNNGFHSPPDTSMTDVTSLNTTDRSDHIELLPTNGKFYLTHFSKKKHILLKYSEETMLVLLVAVYSLSSIVLIMFKRLFPIIF